MPNRSRFHTRPEEPTIISARALAFDYVYYTRRLHNKLGILLLKNGHIRSDPQSVDRLEHLLRLIATFIEKPELCVIRANTIPD